MPEENNRSASNRKQMNNYTYPTAKQLKTIRKWDYRLGFKSLMEYVESVWWSPSWGFKLYSGRDHLSKRRVTKLQLHTGGWSGNESIIDALQRNWIFWALCFYHHRVGGHYQFEIKRLHWLPAKQELPND